MVSTPAAWRLPAPPLSLGAQIEAAFALWLRSARPALPFALAYGLAGLLPALALHDVGTRLLRASTGLVAQALGLPGASPAEDPAALAAAAWAAMTSPSMLAALAAALALATYALTGLLLRQQAIARGEGDGGLAAVARLALRRWPAALLSGTVYTLAMLALATLALLPAWPLFLLAIDAGPGGLLALLFAFFAASLALSVPLVWASVAWGYGPILAALHGTGPLAAHRRSQRLVRGHWPQAATMVTIPLLVYLGLGSTVSSVVYVALGLGVAAAGGLEAVLDGGWILWGQGLAALPMAVCLPLAFSGITVSLAELEARASRRTQLSAA